MSGDAKKTNHWRIEEALHPGSGEPWWAIVTDRGGVVGYFYSRVIATACLRGFKEIGFVPRPEEGQSPKKSEGQ